MPKFCHSCGKQTLFDTGDTDYESGNKHACYSCGFSMWMSESESLYYTCERGSVAAYQPVKSEFEVMFENVRASQVLALWSRENSLFRGLSTDDTPTEVRTIKFRRHKPLNQPPSEA